MRRHARNSLLVLLFAAHIHLAISIPQSLFRRQELFSGLQLPQCALTCFVTGLLTDGCANETDFACHCRDGKIIEKAAACVRQGCGAEDGSDAMMKIGAACNAVGGGSGGGGGAGGVDESRNGDGASSAVNPVSTPIPSPNPSAPGSTPGQRPNPDPNNNNNPQSPSSPTSSTSTLPPSTISTSPTMSPTQPPTDMPLAPLPPSDQLSDGAKAGIAVSVSLIALSIFFALGWYIRRLKRDLAAAQALVPSTSSHTWPPPETSFSPATGTFATAFARTESSRGRRSPVSPLSSPPMIVSDNGYGVLKKKRGNVLSIVVEDDEDRSSLVPSRETGVREPVPGQREGLVDPLELDGVWTGLVEAPLAVTPRERSRER